MKTRKLISVLLSLCLMMGIVCVASINTFADDTIHTSADGLWKYRLLDDGTAEIFNDWECAYLGSDSVVTIPDTIDGHTVTSLGLYTFMENDTVTQINLGDSVKNAERAFVGCVTLESINVSSDNQYLCSVNGVLFSKDMTSLICYPGSKQDSHYTIPDGVEQIMYDAFAMCFYLEGITIPDSVDTLHDEAFAMCSSLEEVVIPQGITNIPTGCFIYCENLSSVTLPGSLASVSESAFEGCAALSEITFGRNIVSIDSYAFTDSGLSTVKGYLGTAAETFANSKGLTFVSLNIEVSGDLNGDEDVTIADYLILQQFIAGDLYELTAAQQNVADIDGDGAIDAFDLFYIDRIINKVF